MMVNLFEIVGGAWRLQGAMSKDMVHGLYFTTVPSRAGDEYQFFKTFFAWFYQPQLSSVQGSPLFSSKVCSYG